MKATLPSVASCQRSQRCLW